MTSAEERFSGARRSFLRKAAGLAALMATPGVIGRANGDTQLWPKGDPFALGVAAGCPSPEGFVIWTRLAPEPLSPDPETPGGMSGPDVAVAYEIAKDSGFREIVRKGEVLPRRDTPIPSMSK